MHNFILLLYNVLKYSYFMTFCVYLMAAFWNFADKDCACKTNVKYDVLEYDKLHCTYFTTVYKSMVLYLVEIWVCYLFICYWSNWTYCNRKCNETCPMYNETRWRQSNSLYWFVSHLKTIGAIVKDSFSKTLLIGPCSSELTLQYSPLW